MIVLLADGRSVPERRTEPRPVNAVAWSEEVRATALAADARWRALFAELLSTQGAHQ